MCNCALLQRGADGSVFTGLTLIHVDGGKVVNVAITPDQTIYRPGANALLNIQVNDANGNPQQAAALVSTAVKHESVFGLSPAKPGVSESYFDLGLRPGDDQSPAASVSINRALSSRDETTQLKRRLRGEAVPALPSTKILRPLIKLQQETHSHHPASSASFTALVEELKSLWEAGEVDFDTYEGVMDRMFEPVDQTRSEKSTNTMWRIGKRRSSLAAPTRPLEPSMISESRRGLELRSHNNAMEAASPKTWQSPPSLGKAVVKTTAPPRSTGRRSR